MEKKARRQQLLDAAIRVFARSGYRAASISDIIAEAEVARGTFYLHFRSKTDVFGAIIDKFVDDLRGIAALEEKRAHPAAGAPGTVRAIIMSSLRYFAANRDLAAVLFRHGASVDPDYKDKCAQALRGIYALWESRIAAHQKLGITNPALDARFIRVSMIGMFVQVVLDYVVREPEADLEKIADQWLELLANGVFRLPEGGLPSMGGTQA